MEMKERARLVKSYLVDFIMNYTNMKVIFEPFDEVTEEHFSFGWPVKIEVFEEFKTYATDPRPNSKKTIEIAELLRGFEVEVFFDKVPTIKFIKNEST